MFLTDSSILVLECQLRVVFDLIADVLIDSGHQRVADRKRSVSRLPREYRGSIFVMLRGLGLYVLDQFRDRKRSRKAKEQMAGPLALYLLPEFDNPARWTGLGK